VQSRLRSARAPSARAKLVVWWSAQLVAEGGQVLRGLGLAFFFLDGVSAIGLGWMAVPGIDEPGLAAGAGAAVADSTIT